MSDHESAGKTRLSLHSYQSVWMAHWTGGTSSTEPQEHNLENNEDHHDTKRSHYFNEGKITSEISGSSKGFREFQGRAFESIDESPTMSLRNLKYERQASQDSPIAIHSQKRERDSIFILENDKETNGMQVLKPQSGPYFEHGTTALFTSGFHFPSLVSVAPHATETSSRECHFQHESVSVNPAEQVKSHRIFGRSFAVSRHSQDDFSGAMPRVALALHGFNPGESEFDSEKTAVPSFVRRQENATLSRSISASKKHLSDSPVVQEHELCNYRSNFSLLVGNRKMDNCSISGKSVMPYIRKINDSPLMLNDPSTSNNCSPVFYENQYLGMQNRSDIRLLPSWSIPPEMTKLDNREQCLQKTKPSCVHDVKSLKICTSVDSVKGLAGSPPNISQKTHSLLIAEKTDVNLCKEKQIFTESKVRGVTPLFAHGQRGVKLQLLGSSTDSEGKEDVQDAEAFEVVPQNESSAETNTMDMDNLKENYISGVEVSPINKDILMDPDLLPYDTSASGGELSRGRLRIPELPDINLELPALPAAANSMDNAEPSTSRSQSLDMDLLLNAELTSNAKPNHCPDGNLGPDSSSRWIKRLKLSATGLFPAGTKSSNLGESSSHEKVSKFVSKIMIGRITDSDSILNKRAGKELLVQTTASSESVSVDNVEKGNDINLSHAWIRRWRRNQAATPQKKPEPEVTCEPRSSKISLKDFQKKQFPSIAAMALTGKAMTGVQPCDFQNRGSFIVWNTKSL